jgi:UDP-N-acetylglucosamine:LPS N-acetylglucosamine transferase
MSDTPAILVFGGSIGVGAREHHGRAVPSSLKIQLQGRLVSSIQICVQTSLTGSYMLRDTPSKSSAIQCSRTPHPPAMGVTVLVPRS